jgi:hypothetical protein
MRAFIKEAWVKSQATEGVYSATFRGDLAMTHRFRLNRRRLLQTGGSATLLAAPAIRSALGQAHLPVNPFTLGVASGYPTPDGVVPGFHGSAPGTITKARTTTPTTARRS